MPLMKGRAKIWIIGAIIAVAVSFVTLIPALVAWKGQHFFWSMVRPPIPTSPIPPVALDPLRFPDEAAIVVFDEIRLALPEELRGVEGQPSADGNSLVFQGQTLRMTINRPAYQDHAVLLNDLTARTGLVAPDMAAVYRDIYAVEHDDFHWGMSPQAMHYHQWIVLRAILIRRAGPCASWEAEDAWGLFIPRKSGQAGQVTCEWNLRNGWSGMILCEGGITEPELSALCASIRAVR